MEHASTSSDQPHRPLPRTSMGVRNYLPTLKPNQQMVMAIDVEKSKLKSSIVFLATQELSNLPSQTF